MDSTIYQIKLTRSRAFKNLPPKTRMGVGAAIIAWGTIGLYVTDSVEKPLGFEPSEQDRQALDAVIPKISIVERDDEKWLFEAISITSNTRVIADIKGTTLGYASFAEDA